MSDLREKVSKAIDALPKDAECIAAFFKKTGVRGKVGSTPSCPIARYVKKEAGLKHVSVNGQRIAFSGEQVATPLWCGFFISKFDNGQYPDLIAPSRKKVQPS